MKKSFGELIKDNDTPVLVDFYADWCGPCKMMHPIVEEVAAELKDKVKVVKINVDQNPQVAQTFQVRSIPTFMLFDKGDVKWRQAGGMSAQTLKTQLSAHI